MGLLEGNVTPVMTRRTFAAHPRAADAYVHHSSIWVAYFEPQALLEKLGIAHGLHLGRSPGVPQ